MAAPVCISAAAIRRTGRDHDLKLLNLFV